MLLKGVLLTNSPNPVSLRITRASFGVAVGDWSQTPDVNPFAQAGAYTMAAVEGDAYVPTCWEGRAIDCGVVLSNNYGVHFARRPVGAQCLPSATSVGRVPCLACFQSCFGLSHGYGRGTLF